MRIDNYFLVIVKYIICSLNFVKNNLFSQKIIQFVKLFFIYLSQKIYHHFIIWIFFIDIISFLGGSYFSKIGYGA